MNWQSRASAGLHLAQTIESLIEGAPGGGFVAEELQERVGAGAVALKGLATGGIRRHSAPKNVGFHSGDAAEAPLSLSELFDQESFRGGESLVLLGEFSEQAVVLGRVFIGQDEVPAGKAVGHWSEVV